MNANGMARGYMAKGMEEKKFFSYVLQCVERELKEWDYDVEINSDWDEKGSICSVRFTINGTGHSVDLDQHTVKKLQAQGPYSLDRLLWEELKKQGVILKQDHYLETVYM